MYSPKQVLIETFITYLQNTYHSAFGTSKPSHSKFLGAMAKRVLGIIAQSDALYHDLEHTLIVTSVGQELLQAKRLLEGASSISPKDWLCVVTALLCHDIGYCKGICRKDKAELGRHSTGIGDNYVFLAFGTTDAALSAYHVDRSKQFVQEQFKDESLIDVAIVQQIIDRTRFPATDIPLTDKVSVLADLGRSADLIGQFSDRNYLQKLPALFYEFEQNGTNQNLGYRHLTDVKVGLSEFYWNNVHSYIVDAIQYLDKTSTGHQIVTELYTNISIPKARLCA